MLPALRGCLFWTVSWERRIANSEMGKRRLWRSCNYAFRLHNCILIVIVMMLYRRRYRGGCDQGEKSVQLSSRATSGVTSIPPRAGLAVPREADVLLRRECPSGFTRFLKWTTRDRILGQQFERQITLLVLSNFRNRDACERGKVILWSYTARENLGTTCQKRGLSVAGAE